MAQTIRELVTRYLCGETTYPEALSKLGSRVGFKQAHEVLRCAVETDDESYLEMVPAAAE